MGFDLGKALYNTPFPCFHVCKFKCNKRGSYRQGKQTITVSPRFQIGRNIKARVHNTLARHLSARFLGDTFRLDFWETGLLNLLATFLPLPISLDTHRTKASNTPIQHFQGQLTTRGSFLCLISKSKLLRWFFVL